MVLFFVALSAEWWNPHVASLVPISTSTIVVFSLVGWCIWTARDRTRHRWFQVDPDQSPHNIVQDDQQGEGGVKASFHSLLMKRIHYFASTYLKTKEHHSTTNDNGPALELDTHHGSHLGPNGGSPNGDAESLHIRVVDEVVEERHTPSASSSPVVPTLPLPVPLPDSPDHFS